MNLQSLKILYERDVKYVEVGGGAGIRKYGTTLSLIKGYVLAPGRIMPDNESFGACVKRATSCLQSGGMMSSLSQIGELIQICRLMVKNIHPLHPRSLLRKRSGV